MQPRPATTTSPRRPPRSPTETCSRSCGCSTPSAAGRRPGTSSGGSARLGSAPKHHLADPALAARLLGADVDSLLEGSAGAPTVSRSGLLLGALFESLVTLSVRVYAQAAEAAVQHLRPRNGDHEVDLVVQRADHRVVALETKLAPTVDDRDTAQLRWLRDRLGDELLDAVVVTTGTDAYRRADGIAVIPAALLGP